MSRNLRPWTLDMKHPVLPTSGIGGVVWVDHVAPLGWIQSISVFKLSFSSRMGVFLNRGW
jgi:hypothetical protein